MIAPIFLVQILLPSESIFKIIPILLFDPETKMFFCFSFVIDKPTSELFCPFLFAHFRLPKLFNLAIKISKLPADDNVNVDGLGSKSQLLLKKLPVM